MNRGSANKLCFPDVVRFSDVAQSVGECCKRKRLAEPSKERYHRPSLQTSKTNNVLPDIGAPRFTQSASEPWLKARLEEDDCKASDQKSFEVALTTGAIAEANDTFSIRSSSKSQDKGEIKDSIGKLPTCGRHGTSISSRTEDRLTPDQCRSLLRKGLVGKMGSASRVFKALDVNSSGCVSLLDFADGITRLGVDWRALTGLKTQREFFRLFDRCRRGFLDFSDLFPPENAHEWDVPRREGGGRPNTTEFWRTWCHETETNKFLKEGPKWQANGPEDELRHLLSMQENRKEAAMQKKWLAASFKRLKSRGKSDARCRELVALHLPRGTGPTDREDVKTFSHHDVRKCKKHYTEEVQEPTRNIQKVVHDMREQRRVLQEQKANLQKALEPSLKELAKLESDKATEDFRSLFKKASAKPEAETEDEPAKPVAKSFKMIAMESDVRGFDEENLNDMYGVFIQFADMPDETLTKKASFSKIVDGLCKQKRTLAKIDLDAHWSSLSNVKEIAKDKSATKPPHRMFDAMAEANDSPPAKVSKVESKVGVTFEQFAKWFSTSEYFKP